MWSARKMEKLLADRQTDRQLPAKGVQLLFGEAASCFVAVVALRIVSTS